MQMKAADKVFLAGHRGLVGSALQRRLEQGGYQQIVTAGREALDLRDAAEVERFFAEQRPDVVLLAAAKVGGILANSQAPADFLHDNLAIQTNVMHQAYRHDVRQLLFLGSSCIYPRLAPQPMAEEHLLTGPLEQTNEPYAIAKIAGIKLCGAYNRQYSTDFLCVMPTNLYGPGDHFDLQNSHVLPALLRKMHEAQVGGQPAVEIWGSGEPRREFLHCDDLADACVHLMENHHAVDLGEFVNIGAGEDISIQDLALLIAEIVGFTGELTFDAEKPDGTPRKLLDISRLQRLGWTSRIPLREGIRQTYQWYCQHGPAPTDVRRSQDS
jgi:GDP-L-fucose synthase